MLKSENIKDILTRIQKSDIIFFIIFYKLIPAIRRTIHHAAATTNIPIAAYIKLLSAFLNSSVFPLAMSKRPQINRNIAIAATARRANILSLTKSKTESNGANSPSAVVIIPWAPPGVIAFRSSSLDKLSTAKSTFICAKADIKRKVLKKYLIIF